MDIHCVAEQYLRELETGLAAPVERKEVEENNSFILLRNNTYFYGHHPRTGEAKWTHDAQLAQIMTPPGCRPPSRQIGNRDSKDASTYAAPKRGGA